VLAEDSRLACAAQRGVRGKGNHREVSFPSRFTFYLTACQVHGVMLLIATGMLAELWLPLLTYCLAIALIGPHMLCCPSYGKLGAVMEK
jgi:hypothetical protein